MNLPGVLILKRASVKKIEMLHFMRILALLTVMTMPFESTWCQLSEDVKISAQAQKQQVYGPIKYKLPLMRPFLPIVNLTFITIAKLNHLAFCHRKGINIRFRTMYNITLRYVAGLHTSCLFVQMVISEAGVPSLRNWSWKKFIPPLSC